MACKPDPPDLQKCLEPNFAEIENYLNQFPGGNIVLSKKFFDRGLAVIYFSNPGKKNAISGTMMVQLRECILELEKWKEGKGVFICGLGGNFCSGGDLDFARASGTPEKALKMSNWMQDILTRLQNLPLVSTCLVQGPTLGGGAEISVFCDYILAADDVSYGFVHGKMGIITAWGGTTRLVQKIGHKKALNLLLTSQMLSAKQCVDFDIADHIVPASNAFAKAIEWIDYRLQHDYRIVRSFKKVVHTALNEKFEDSLKLEKRLFSLTWGSELNRAALANNIKHLRHNNSKV